MKRNEILTMRAEIQRASDEGDARRIEFVATTGVQPDRAGDIYDIAGIGLNNFKKNPVMLLQHDRSAPIARVDSIRKEGDLLLGSAIFPPAGVSQRADEVYGLIRAEVLNAVSVGIAVMKYEPLKKDDPYGPMRVTKSELREISVVSIPSDVDAVITARSEEADAPSNVGAVQRQERKQMKFKTLQELLAYRETKVARQSELANFVIERELTDEEKTELAGIRAEITELNARAEIFEAAAAEAARSATVVGPAAPAAGLQRAAETARPAHVDVTPNGQPVERGLAVGMVLRALYQAQGNGHLARQIIDHDYNQPELARALGTGAAGTGGVLVPTRYAAEFIELLRAASVVRRAGPRVISFDGVGTISIPRATAGATAAYVGENTSIGYSQMATDAVTLTPKKCAALTAVSAELLRRSTPGADGIIRDDIIAAIATKSDSQFLTGTGSASAPGGILVAVAGGNKFDAQATPDVTKVTQDLNKAMQKVAVANVPMEQLAWFLHPSIGYYLRSLRTGDLYAFRDEMLRGTLLGIRMFETTAMPLDTITEGELTVGLMAMNQVVLAEETALTLSLSDQASYDAGGGLISAFQLDQTVVKATISHDITLRHAEAGAVITDAAWVLP